MIAKIHVFDFSPQGEKHGTWHILDQLGGFRYQGLEGLL
jgi:hypothetical protein